MKKGTRINRSKTRNWRRVHCEDCPRRCSYLEFTTDEFRGASRAAVFKRAAAILRHGQDDQPAKWRQRTVHTILGMLHETKRDAWEAATRACREHRDEHGLAVGLGVHPITLRCQWCGSRRVLVLFGKDRQCAACGRAWRTRRSRRIANVEAGRTEDDHRGDGQAHEAGGRAPRRSHPYDQRRRPRADARVAAGA